jgi:hypothetical protein
MKLSQIIKDANNMMIEDGDLIEDKNIKITEHILSEKIRNEYLTKVMDEI